MSGSKLRDVVAYILKHYPDNLKHELSTARLTKIVYLSDWKSAIESGRQITDIHWFFDNYGPYVDDVKRVAEQNRDLFDVEITQNMYGSPKRMFRLKKSNLEFDLEPSEKKYLDHTIEQTKKLYWNDFIKLVYATFPVASSNRYSQLDLVSKAAEYVRR